MPTLKYFHHPTYLFLEKFFFSKFDQNLNLNSNFYDLILLKFYNSLENILIPIPTLCERVGTNVSRVN